MKNIPGIYYNGYLIINKEITTKNKVKKMVDLEEIIDIHYCKCGHTVSFHADYDRITKNGVESYSGCDMCECKKYEFGKIIKKKYGDILVFYNGCWVPYRNTFKKNKDVRLRDYPICHDGKLVSYKELNESMLTKTTFKNKVKNFFNHYLVRFRKIVSKKRINS